MRDPEGDSQLQFTARRVAELSERAEIDLQHMARLREELLRRHQELLVGSTQRTTGSLWPHFARLKRLTLVAPPALAAAIAFSVLLWAVQVSGHQKSQAALAADITRALDRTVPTVTGWQVTLRQTRGNATVDYRADQTLKAGERLYIRNDKTYFYSQGKWYVVTPEKAGGSFSTGWQWAFAALPARLTQRDLIARPGRAIDGRSTEKIIYTTRTSPREHSVMTAWIDRQSGLVLRLERVTFRNGSVVERDTADYRYTRSQ
jgi:hypothetical protein